MFGFFSLGLILPDKPIFSHSSPRCILAILDWDFGGSHALPYADRGFEVCWPDLDDNVDVREKDVDEICRFQDLIDQLAGAVLNDVQLNKSVHSTKLYTLNREALEASGKDSSCPDDCGVDAVGSVPDDTEVGDPL